LVKELDTRFRSIENPKTYGVKFTRRDQKIGETVEEYAAVLKELYDKAHPGRDEKTRQEDLLRRFLDGLTDEKAKFQVEFVKAPISIDEAVDEVVNYTETQNKVYLSKKLTRMVRPIDSDDESDTDEDEKAKPVNRVHLKPGKENKPEVSELQAQVEELRKQMSEVVQKVDKRPAYNNNGRKNREFTGNCYNCGMKGHIKRNCRNAPLPASGSLNAQAIPFAPTENVMMNNGPVHIPQYVQMVPQSQENGPETSTKNLN